MCEQNCFSYNLHKFVPKESHTMLSVSLLCCDTVFSAYGIYLSIFFVQKHPIFFLQHFKKTRFLLFLGIENQSLIIFVTMFYVLTIFLKY